VLDAEGSGAEAPEDWMEETKQPVSAQLDHATIATAIAELCARFGDDYWLNCDADARFPIEFHRAIADAGWLGIAMPEAYGGAGLGISEAAVMMRAVAEAGAGMTGASAIHMNIFGLQPVVAVGTEDQKRRFLPPLITGAEKACFAVTEADAGLDTSHIRTRADRTSGGYLVSGRKIWASTALVADRALILARTTAREDVVRPTDGMSLFYAPLDPAHVEIRPIRKMGRHGVDSNLVYFDALPVSEADRIGEEGNGFRHLLHGLNAERILIAAEAVGLGRAAVRKASTYAVQREVFGRPIGVNQGIQHPLARCWMELEAADLMVMRAAALHDAGQPCGLEANSAKYLAAEAAFSACETAVMTHGGMGYAAEYHVERYLRECLIPRIAPISPQMILNFVAEKALGLPRSY
jgi:acyl-CoA dehydrogenase